RSHVFVSSAGSEGLPAEAPAFQMVSSSVYPRGPHIGEIISAAAQGSTCGIDARLNSHASPRRKSRILRLARICTKPQAVGDTGFPSKNATVSSRSHFMTQGLPPHRNPRSATPMRVVALG